MRRLITDRISTICRKSSNRRDVVSQLLNEAGPDGCVGNYSAGRQEVAASPAAGTEPSLIEAQQVAVRRQRGALADIAEDVNEGRKVFGQFVKHVAESGIALTRERSVRMPSE